MTRARGRALACPLPLFDCLGLSFRRNTTPFSPRVGFNTARTRGAVNNTRLYCIDSCCAQLAPAPDAPSSSRSERRGGGNRHDGRSWHPAAAAAASTVLPCGRVRSLHPAIRRSTVCAALGVARWRQAAPDPTDCTGCKRPDIHTTRRDVQYERWARRRVAVRGRLATQIKSVLLDFKLDLGE